MAAEGTTELVKVVALLGAGVVAVPLFRRIGLGSVLGYLAGGLLIGPYGFGLFSDPQAILHVAELGVVMFLFIIGLEMQPSRLWSLRRQIFGLGAAQVAVCGALLTLVGIAGGLRPPVAFIAAMGFVLSSTAVIIQVLDERGRHRHAARPEDGVHPPARGSRHRAAAGARGLLCARHVGASSAWVSMAIGAASLACLVAAGAVAAQPAVPHPGGRPGARGDDGRRPAGGARRRPADATRRPLHGAGGLPGGRAAGRVDVPPPARSRYRAVPRHPARAVLSQRGHVARPGRDRARMAHHRCRRAGLHGREGHRHLCSWRAS